jgi:hypothetical protein
MQSIDTAERFYAERPLHKNTACRRRPPHTPEDVVVRIRRTYGAGRSPAKGGEIRRDSKSAPQTRFPCRGHRRGWT